MSCMPPADINRNDLKKERWLFEIDKKSAPDFGALIVSRRLRMHRH